MPGSYCSGEVKADKLWRPRRICAHQITTVSGSKVPNYTKRSHQTSKCSVEYSLIHQDTRLALIVVFKNPQLGERTCASMLTYEWVGCHLHVKGTAMIMARNATKRMDEPQPAFVPTSATCWVPGFGHCTALCRFVFKALASFSFARCITLGKSFLNMGDFKLNSIDSLASLRLSADDAGTLPVVA